MKISFRRKLIINIVHLMKDSDGAEVAEWVIVITLLTFIGIAIYQGLLLVELSDTVDAIGERVIAAMPTS